jgi:uncharacterized protein (DUF1697 family)
MSRSTPGTKIVLLRGINLGPRNRIAMPRLRDLLTDAAATSLRHRREIYAWHPEGVARSKLWTLLAGRGLGVTATARNWTTVTNLLALADERAQARPAPR